jgi:hypothetical protein
MQSTGEDGHVTWVPFHQSMVRPQVVDGGDGGQPTRGGPPASGLGMGLTTAHRKK